MGMGSHDHRGSGVPQSAMCKLKTQESQVTSQSTLRLEKQESQRRK